MKDINISDLEIISGGGDLNACGGAMMGAAGIGALVGAGIGALTGPLAPFASFAGAMVGAGLASAYAATNNPSCQPSPGAPPTTSAGLDGDESFA